MTERPKAQEEEGEAGRRGRAREALRKRQGRETPVSEHLEYTAVVSTHSIYCGSHPTTKAPKLAAKTQETNNER